MNQSRKKKYGVVLSILLVAALVLTACGSKSGSESSESAGTGGGSSDKPIEMTINNVFPSNAAISKNVFDKWAEYIEEQTQGKVKVNLYHNGSLGGLANVFDDVKAGVYDMGLALSNTNTNTTLFPLTIGDLPFAGAADTTTTARIMQQFNEKYHDIIFKDVVSVGVATPPPSYYFSKKPIASTDDFKNLSIATASDSEVAITKSLGAVPVPVVFEERYNGLDKGIIGAILTPPELARDNYFYEVAPNMLDIPVRYVTAIPIVNKEFYASLPDDLKTQFNETIFPKYIELFIEHSTNESLAKDDIISEIQKEKTGVVTPVDDATAVQLKEMTKPLWNDWIKTANDKGYPGEEMMNEYKKILKEHGVAVTE